MPVLTTSLSLNLIQLPKCPFKYSTNKFVNTFNFAKCCLLSNWVALQRSLAKSSSRASGQVLSLVVTWPVFTLISGPPILRGPALSPKFQQSLCLPFWPFLIIPPSFPDKTPIPFHKVSYWQNCLIALLTVNTLPALLLQKWPNIVLSLSLSFFFFFLEANNLTGEYTPKLSAFFFFKSPALCAIFGAKHAGWTH